MRVEEEGGYKPLSIIIETRDEGCFLCNLLEEYCHWKQSVPGHFVPGQVHLAAELARKLREELEKS